MLQWITHYHKARVPLLKKTPNVKAKHNFFLMVEWLYVSPVSATVYRAVPYLVLFYL